MLKYPDKSKKRVIVRRCYKFILLLLLSVSSLYAQKPYVRSGLILASGNLKFVFPQMIQAFYEKYPNASVHIEYEASGNLANAILTGKEYDIYFSANRSYPKKIYEHHKSATKPRNYAQGILILFVPKNLPLKREGLRILSNKKIRHIVIANKTTAPYGAAAMQTLKNSKCCETILHKVHYSSDVATAIDDVIWKGDAGFLSKSALYILPSDRKTKGVDWIEIDQRLYSPIIQAYVISQEGLQNPNAQKFIHFINSTDGQKIFRDNGYKNIKPILGKQ